MKELATLIFSTLMCTLAISLYIHMGESLYSNEESIPYIFLLGLGITATIFIQS
jgi:hypothetical protein